MKITRIIRDIDRITVCGVDADNKVFVRHFDKKFTIDEIRASVLGQTELPKEPVISAGADVKKEEKLPTVPTPPQTNRQRVSREQMISVLAAADIKVDVYDPVKLRSAYKALIAKGGEK